MNTKMRSSPAVSAIAMGSDHGGYLLKEKLKKFLAGRGYQIEDVGTHSKESVDYPVFAAAVARKVASGECDRGIVIDGAGIGSCMAANKIPGVRAAMCYDAATARNSREHNDANVLTLGAGMIGWETSRQIVDIWLNTECAAERHRRRVRQIMQLEAGTTPAAVQIDNKTYENNSGGHVKQFSDAELEAIAVQISQILEKQGVAPALAPSQCTCCGGNCGGLCAEKSAETVRRFISMGAGRITYTEGGNGVPQDIAAHIDHTLLRPDASSADVIALCKEARKYRFASVCVNPTFVPLVARELNGSPVKVCSVIGFPFGTHMPEIKALEARRAIRDGASEIDMVINIGALKDRDLNLLYRDIRSVVEACDDGSAICKVIIETALLSDEEKILACETAKRARAEFVKTSTGYASGGATAHDVELMAKVVRGAGMGVKASGGIRSYADAVKMMEAGATRIGASASVKIVQGAAEITESGR